MPTVTFYTHVADLEIFACRLAKRAVEAGCRVLVWGSSAEQLATLDRQLWAFEAESFLPHEIWLPETSCPAEPLILLAEGEILPAVGSHMVVLNLSAGLWSDAPNTPERVLEIVGHSETQLATARRRFAAYRSGGFKIEHHNMQGKA
ncbi:DNA polymerase III subunit chi [Eikenella sp. NML080894]|uniref:DNA polymerase III subunit chi n=1 Tax=Eikenella TaxID=538 RepID=UPI0007E17AA6|nr:MULTISPECIES: DNA polymerase III subunit chi [Eikenella]OAM35794.1 DNA polymerase III subunit chi [Eikenella sp. NML080894]OAM35973.1 DNA polymerase III subunit chi [Eikenella sp. NML120348]OAM44992.1 DNA polymerase III subunit chi [Eikenella sp. NML99-0057]